ncbi:MULTISPECIES: signal peptidase II [Ruminococcus]|uniref:Lipoprotein signal peptidase n=1 Tax=Ruminococcus albus 8 TaxID=246199 RepID=E9SEN2_RUMAL|nr:MULTISPECIES: signal peptidase II [Ruminococcus]EGC02240.1 signal peptidase II [Ruminococcus albus 8]MBR0530958.1 signal peptidase II [Ruminococcus sp.]MCC3351732.1 signal peptidase II [Ruminococcus albus 8]
MFALSLILAALLVAIDQCLKVVVDNKIELGQVIEVIKFGSFKLFSLTHIRNTGAAWSIMSGKTWFLVLLPIVVCIAGIVYMYKIRKGSKLEMISVAMIISGGVGNLIDRVRMHEVIDYIKFEPINFPIFNFADICIVIGAILFCLSIIISDVKKSKADKAGEKNG